MRGDPVSPTLPSIDAALKDAQASQPATSSAPPPEVAAALLPPVTLNLPEAAQPAEPRFDVAVNHVPAQQFFMGLVDGTAYNMVVHPEVGGEISLNLKNVTVDEVMNTVNSVYGYEYSRNGSVFEVLPARLRSHVFKVDYLNMRRIGASQTRVSSGQITQNETNNSGNNSNGSNNTNNTNNSNNTGNTNNNTGANNNSGGTNAVSGSQVNTQSEADFWRDLKTSLELLIGTEGDHRVVVNPQAGIVVVRAMPGELREIGDYLSTLQNAVERQVVLEAKIIEVELNDGFQAGINWAALGEPGNNKSIVVGQFGGGTLLDDSNQGRTFSAPLGDPSNAFEFSTFGGMFGIAADLNDFAALIELLKTQGQVQVLSSPRVSTVNNQKAVIKVGSDEFFVTDIDTNTDTTNGTSNQSVDVQLTPFFSGVALDVIPQINDKDEVILHIHPTISEVTEQTKDITLNTSDTLNVPLARSTIRESDAIVRARSGQVIVIGGLMKDAHSEEKAKTPFLGDLPGVGAAFRHTRERATKSELVILLRPHVISGAQGWNDMLQSTNRRIDSLQDSGATPR
ncbi:MAG: pilus (MSHA type) biogenesis protein MshL [Gammaproteobacteria bacterium]|nr:pilus (MSHA type) biogenesis protein MshL [Gammaproteobacteria bacterium]